MALRSILFVFRRNSLRLRKLRNLLLIVFVLLFLYTFKNVTEIDKNSKSIQQQESNHQPMKEGLLQRSDKDIPNFVPASKKKIDWHNYTQIKHERSRFGIGEQGKPAVLPEGQRAYEKSLYSVNGFNGALSDLIPLNRSLPDIRHRGCRKKKYIESLPTVSVVVPFHNEHWSTLLRTAFSVLYRSPKDLIKEIILVDDASTKGFLKKKLDDYLAENMPKVRTLRLGARSGLITARLVGAKAATGDVLIFLDSHSEANVNWLPPLLEPIALDYRTVVCPFIDVVAYDTFEYRAQDEGARGAFDWEFFYKRLPLLPKDVANMPEPFESPVMAGGLFAISRKWFWELGGYDPQLDIWGGEQYEISFKIWQCGGRMVDAPCSRVGHIYRKFAPFPNPGHGDFVGKNYRRVAEVWMDEYAKYLYKRRPHYRNIDTGDLTAQLAIRRRLHCKPFKWFMTQIAFDLASRYPMVEPPPYAFGKIQTHKGDFCIDAARREQNDNVKLAACDSGIENEWVLTWHKDVRLNNRNTCWDVPESAAHSPVKLYNCHGGGGNQQWRYDHALKQFKHQSGACLDWDPNTVTVFVNKCLPAADKPHSQQWKIETVHIERLEEFDNVIEPVTGPLPYEEPPTNGSSLHR